MHHHYFQVITPYKGKDYHKFVRAESSDNAINIVHAILTKPIGKSEIYAHIVYICKNCNSEPVTPLNVVYAGFRIHNDWFCSDCYKKQ